MICGKNLIRLIHIQLESLQERREKRTIMKKIMSPNFSNQIKTLSQWFSTGADFALKDIEQCLESFLVVTLESNTGIQWVESRDAAKHSAMCRQPHHVS